MVNQNQSRLWGWVGAIVAAVLVIWGISAIWGGAERNRTTTVETTPPANMSTPNETIPDTTIANNPAVPATPGMTAPVAPGTAGTTGKVDYVLTEESDFDTNPDKYVGATISVEGEINNVVGQQAHAFTVDTDGAIGGDEVLILTKAGATAPIEKGTKVHVVGVGRKLQSADLAPLEAELGYKLDNNLMGDFDQKIVIVAESLGATAH